MEINLRKNFILVVAGLAMLADHSAHACPFCAATSPTIREELDPAEVVALARLISVEPAAKRNGQVSIGSTSVARYEILDVLRGDSALRGVRLVEVPDASEQKPGSIRMLTACGAPRLTWSESHRLTERSREYVRRSAALPAEGADRLEFFYEYLEDAEELIAQDAYNEFATAPYDEVRLLRAKMDRRRLAERIADPKTPANRRGLLYTMLGVCGTAEELPLLEGLLRRGSRENPGSFDAILAAYISLRGAAGLDTIDELFLRVDSSADKKLDLADSHAAIRALRFHLEEQHGVAKNRIMKSLRLVLERQELASVVIADLARWQDWDALPRLVELFKKADGDASGLRVQVVNYLLICPLPEAAKQLDELARIAPGDVERARILSVYGKGAPSAPQPPGVPVPE